MVLTDLFFPTFANHFLITQGLIIKISSQLANIISRILRSQQKKDA